MMDNAQEPCLASLRWLGRLPDLFRHQLVAGILYDDPYDDPYDEPHDETHDDQELCWTSHKSLARATAALVPVSSSLATPTTERSLPIIAIFFRFVFTMFRHYCHQPSPVIQPWIGLLRSLSSKISQLSFINQEFGTFVCLFSLSLYLSL